ncbi:MULTISPECIES: hypothetical protein [Pseudoalteromonas]|nr:hypothetical protein [Pseudoalteromonas sp. PAR1]
MVQSVNVVAAIGYCSNWQIGIRDHTTQFSLLISAKKTKSLARLGNFVAP